MKKKILSMLCVLILVIGVLAVGSAVSATDEIGNLKVGYAKISIDPIDKEGTYRTIDYTSILTGSGNATLKAELAAAGVTTVNPYYTVSTLPVDCNNDGIENDGYFSVPLSGYGNVDERMSIGKMDDNGDGVINDKDGNFVSCIAVTDEKGQTLLFFSLDLANSAYFAAASVKDGIREALMAVDASYDIPSSNMLFSASHSHSAPDTGLNNAFALPINAAQRAYRSLVNSKVKEVAIAAMNDRTEVTVSSGEIQADNMNATRHYNASEEKRRASTGTLSSSASWVYGDNFGAGLPSDTYVHDGSGSYTSGSYRYNLTASNVSESNETLQLLQFKPINGGVPIVMVNFRAHPKLNSFSGMGYGADNKFSNSPDYVGMLREKLEVNGYRASFIQGAAGNQSTWNYLDDTYLTPAVTNTTPGTAMYKEIVAYRAPDGSTTNGSYNDRMAFINYTAASGKTYNAQTGYSYGARLADYAIQGLKNNMTDLDNGVIKVNQTFFTGEAQTFSAGYKAAAEAYYNTTHSSASESFQYKYTDGKYYNINSSYHANAIRNRSNDASEVDTKVEINCITIGSLAFLSAPNELYDRYNMNGVQDKDNLWDAFNAAAQGAGYIKPLFLGYTNGGEGYIPNVAAYEYNRANNNAGSVTRPTTGGKMVMGVGAYEANTSKFAPGSGEQLIVHFQEALLSMETLNRPTTCPMCGQENVQWEAIGQISISNINGGHYYLADDLVYHGGTNAVQRIIYGDSCIDLNGHTAGNSADEIGRAFYVVENKTLRMMNGTVKGRGSNQNNNGGVIYMETGSSLYLTNVNVIREMHDGQTTKYGGTIYANTGCTVDINGGSVTGGQATTAGGNIYANTNAVVKLSDVTISGGASVTGGNLYAYTGVTLDLDSVTLENGTATGNGDNICCWSPKVHIYGDSVLKGECYFSSSGATTKFSGNVQAWDSPNGENIKVAGSSTRLTFENLSNTAKISIQGGAVITNTTAFQYVGKQLTADEGYYLDTSFTDYGIFVGNKWMCECGGKAEDKHTCEPRAYAPWSSQTSLPTVGNYYLNEDVTITAQHSPSNTYKTLRLDLAGHSITHAVDSPDETRVFSLGTGELLTVTDTVGTGSMKRDLTNLTEEQRANITDYGLIACLANNGTFRMYGGTANAQGQNTGGGAIAGTTGNTTIEIYGGTVLGASARVGGCIYSQGTVKLYGGQLTGGKASSTGGGVYMTDSNAKLTLTGDACVTGNYLSDGTTANNIVASKTQLTVSGTYTGTAGLVVSSPAVNLEVGIADNANISGATLTVDGSDDYRFMISGKTLKLAASAGAVVMDAVGNTHGSMQAALKEYTGSGKLTLLNDVTDDFTLTQDTTIDLAGFSITGTVTYEDGAKLILADRNTDDYDVEDGESYGTVPYSANVQAAEGYLVFTTGGKTSAHKYNLTLSDVNLRPSNAGIYYNSKFLGDQIVKGNIKEFGVALSVDAPADAQYINADTEYKTHTGFANTHWTVGMNNTTAPGTILTNVLDPANGYTVNKSNASTDIYGVAYIRLKNETIVLGASRNYSLKDIVEIAARDEYWNTWTEVQRNGIVDMYASYKTVMRNWNIDNIKAAADS